MKRMAVICVAAVALSLGCAGAPAVQEGGAKGAGMKGAGKKDAVSVKVPLTAIPPPGQCTIWSPERAVESASAPCPELATKVKSGDWLLSRSVKNADVVQVFVYGDIGIIRETHQLDAATGATKTEAETSP